MVAKNMSPLFYRLLYLLLVLILFSACKPKITYTLSFEVSSEYDFVGLTRIEGEEHFCFLKKRFNPNLKIFNAEGVLKDSVPLSEAEKILGEITCVYGMNRDSIYIYAINNNSFLAVDYNGLPLQQRKYTHIISDVKNNCYGLFPSYAYLPFMSDNSSSMSSATTAIGNPSHPKQIYDNVRENGYFICKLHPFGQKEIDFGIRFSDVVEFSTLPDSTFSYSPYFFVVNANNRTYMYSYYSRYIYELSENLSVTRTIKILSDQDSVSFAVPFIEGIDNLDEELLQYRTAKTINSMHYNPVTDNYLVIIKNGDVIGNDWRSFPFKVLIYDSSFTNKIKEMQVGNYDYIPHKSFVINGKLYMQKNNESHNIKKYEIIEL